MNKKSNHIIIGGKNILTLDEVIKVAREKALVNIDKTASSLLFHSHRFLLKHIKERLPIYGVNTQFGSQVNIFDSNLIKHNDFEYLHSISKRQSNLVKSHNCSLGKEVPVEIVRSTMLLRSHCLALGYSGVRIEVVQALKHFLNQGIHPIVYQYGSIGASGDLIPLAAIAAAMDGEEVFVYFRGEKMKASKALRVTKTKPLNYEGREGIALINGTSFMGAIASLAFYDLKRLFHSMLSAIAMTLESLLIIDSAYAPIVHKLKNHKGEIEVNDFLIRFWRGSRLVRNLDALRKKEGEHFKVNQNHNSDLIQNLQDYYSLRSVPHGFGPFKENLDKAIIWIENEINSVNDNPVINIKTKKIYHTANFMGYYVTSACDTLKNDIAQASTWIHALLANLFHPRKNLGLPANLINHQEIYNGFRPLQILAASITVQNRKLAQTQQAYMLPTEGDNQDVNSLGTHAAFDIREAVENLERLTAILLLAATQALDWRGIKKAGWGSTILHKKVRRVSKFIDADRNFREDIERVINLIREEDTESFW